MLFKCKMCGGDISFNQGDTSGVCEYCGSTSTIPRVDDEQRLNRFNRANHFRRQGEFDKAIAAYERILEEDDRDAEAHWGVALSRYGIEYVEDPVTRRRVPTCHRVQVESILADADYQAALENAPDTRSRSLYEEQAKEIALIQKEILSISAREKPYDVFICYKESDENGKRTRDSALAQEVYYGLEEQGYKVFFSRITLEDKLGQEYEPYIFAALHSARVMVVIGTKPEYFSAVWVRNEWSRYLHLMKEDRRRLLIPCYRDMDPYDLPEELSNLQSQDMSRIGFMQDLLRGIRKVLEGEGKKEAAEEVKTVVQQVVREGGSHVNALLDRASLALEDGEWEKADDFCEQALNMDARNSRAYLGKLMVERQVRKAELLSDQAIPLEKSSHYQKSLRFANAEQKRQLEGWNQAILERNERNRKIGIRDEILGRLKKAATIQECLTLQKELEAIKGFDGVQEAMDACEKKAQEFREKKYNYGISLMKDQKWDDAIYKFKEIEDYRDSRKLIEDCKKGIQESRYQFALNQEKNKSWDAAVDAFRNLGSYRDSQQRMKACEEAREKAEQERKALEEQARLIAEREAKEEAAKKKRMTIIFSAVAVLAIAILLLVTKVFIPKGHYDQGINHLAAGEWEQAIQEFTAAGSYGDAAAKITETEYMRKQEELKGHYDQGVQYLASGEWEKAIREFTAAGNYSDASTQITETEYERAGALYDSGDYASALIAYQQIAGYKDVDSLLAHDSNLLAAARAERVAPFQTVGSVVTFGHYEQDNHSENGPEEIEWIVLDVQEGMSLLLSRYLLDAKPYHTEFTNVTWETCSMRNWLNQEFLNAAFTAEEQTAILTTPVDNGKSQGYSGYSTDGGNNTQDRIFLLSYQEAFDLYFTDDSDRKCAPTDYAIAQGAYTNSKIERDGRATGWWWLRSLGSSLNYAMNVSGVGSRYSKYVDYDSGCVRPAFWINLESDIF